MSAHLFVYGTLLPVLAPASLRSMLARWRPVGPAFMPGRLYDLGDYPGAILDATAASRVYGEVFLLPKNDDTLARLDAYEGYHLDRPQESLFTRQLLPIRLRDGSELPCWVYLYERDVSQAKLIPSGDYATWLASQNQSSET